MICLMLLFLPSCSNADKPADMRIDFEKEKAAIIAVMEAESAAFWQKDFAAFSSCWLQDSAARIMGWWPDGGISVTEGWDAIGAKIEKMMKDNPDPNATPSQLQRANMNVRITSNMAWLTFDQYALATGDSTFDMNGLSHETRVLEKHNGQWKIAYVGWLLEKGKRKEE